ncbi:DEAD/DEAH box helicase [uncultured Succinivibrio sp.]|uniref:DEAD/DEAH box helicase n=1 Tax=uncultured Succinivibrio sp. TaxID=540749 RepID=UPI0025DE2CD5|nr:DEAD/DEAH box helicase [uncultured Succinivibrio sp.]
MANKYGTTWWGERWLNALTGIDEENRIPRGLSYANSDKVYALNPDINRGVIKARVKGNYDPFYSVKIELPQFTSQERKALLDAIAKSPVILAKLSARELAPEIEEEASKLGINIFPRKWDDLKFKCSCPDYAVPCKHIAAVIYKFSQEIDANPFILFELKGLDIVAELKRLNINLEQVEQTEMPSWKEILEQPGLDKMTSIEDLIKASYIEIPDLLDSVLGLFKPSPAGFVEGDLRAIVKKCLIKAAKLADKQLKDKTDRDLPEYNDSNPLLTIDSWGRNHLDKTLFWTIHPVENNGEPLKKTPFDPASENYENAPYYEMFSGTIEPRKIEEAPYEIEAMYHAWFIATKLVTKGAVIPQIYEPIEDFFCVRWIPSIMSDEVRKVVDEVGKAFLIFPDSTIRIDRRPEHLSASVLGEIILSFFIESYIIKAFTTLYPDSYDNQSIEISSVFLRKFVDIEEDIAGERVKLGLESWIAPIYLQNLKVLPVIILEDRSALSKHTLDAIIEEARDVKEEASDEEATDEENADNKYVDIAADETDTSLTAPVVDDEIELLPLRERTLKKLFANKDGVSITMGFNRLDKAGIPEEAFIPLTQILENNEYKKIRFECLRTVARLSSVCPVLTELLEDQKGEGIISLDSLAEIILSTIPAMRLLGVKLIVPKSLKKVLTPKSAMTIGTDGKWDESMGYMGLADLLNFHWDLALGNHPISEGEFNELRKHEGKVVRFRNSFVYVDPSVTSRIAKKLLTANATPTKQRLMAAALTGHFGQNNVQITKELQSCLKNILSEKSIEVPPTLQANLRPYQQRGYSWLTRNLRTMMGSIIADDMGLGKTLQVIAAIEKLRYDGELEDKQVLIVVPTSLLVNWSRELTKFAPQITYNIYYAEKNLKNHTHVVITTYGVLKTELNNLKKLKLRLMVIDEAQAIKNNKSQVFRAVRAIKADSMIAMSGTPVENRLMEYWSIMDFTNPGLLGTTDNFKKEFAAPIEKERNIEAVNSFKRVTAPFIMRRLKTDRSVIDDLPEKISTDKFCTLTPQQVALYQEKVDISMKIMKNADPKIRAAVVLNLIQSLKQICNAPAQFSKEDKFQDAKYAGKMEVLFDLLDEMRENKKKTLIFTQFKSMGDLLQKWIRDKTGFEPQFLHGGVPSQQRARMVDRFQNKKDEQCMILSLKAAGTGLNLTAASSVIHYDLWWNPAVESQATDRAYRIGQKNNVQVYRFICANTFEEKINDIINSKKELADLTVNTGEKWIGDLSNRQIEEIFSISEN